MKSKKAQPNKTRTSKNTARKPARKKSKASSLKNKLFKIALLGLLVFVLALFALFGAVYIGLFGKLPEAEEILALRNANASELYSSDGKLLGKYYFENRSSIGFDDIPEHVVNALVATEDSRFFEHEGIDLYSIPRVVIKTIILGDRSGGGGSTISQQLVKNLYGRSSYGVLSMPVNKLKENVIALKVEEVYNKQEIITLYLNTVSFGENVFGIKAASQRFFSKLPKDLSVSEAATLIGMLKANTSYNPRLYPEASRTRRNTVLALMVKEGFLEAESLNVLMAKPIELKYNKMEGFDAPAAYFHAFAEREIKRLLEEAGKANGTTYDLYRDGLRITTTVHSALQKHAEDATKTHMRKLQASFDSHWKGQKPWGKDEAFLWKLAEQSTRYKRLENRKVGKEEIRRIFNTKTSLLRFGHEGYERVEMTPLDSVAYHQMVLQMGFLAMNPESGAMLAYVGGINHSHFPYDHVHSARQVGSTFKPFVYATAIAQGFSPCDYIANERIIFSNYDDWSPENSNGKYGGFYSLRGGLANSVNTVAAQLIAETGPEAVIETAKAMGIARKLPPGPAISLGVADISLLEMVRAYSAFANGGFRVEPHYITSIMAADGSVIYQAESAKKEQAVDSYAALTTLHMLQAVVDSGTARSLRSTYGLRMPLAGKTGTTQNNADGWFIAAAPGLVCGAWVGGESPTVRFRSTALGQGAATALPLVGSFLQKVSKDPAAGKIIKKSFPDIPAQIVLDSYCPMYVESKTERLFESLFDRDTRDAKRELREQVRQERLQKQMEDGGDEEEGGWMKRLIKKLKKD